MKAREGGRAPVVAVCLDGYEYSLAERMMCAGELPQLQALSARSTRCLLDHGDDLRTGLAGEHVASGLSPDAAGRWAAVQFDPRTYGVWQQGTSLRPFPSRYDFRSVVFDAPYFDLARAPEARGLVSWGAHDPGVPPFARPTELWEEIEQRFGPYPAKKWIYGTPWSSVAQTKEMGEKLAAAVRLRSDVTSWLLRERFEEWDLAFITVSESHSAIEGLWHGVDSTHPLHGVPSSAAARTGVEGVYRAIDDLLGGIVGSCPDASIAVFAMHGMGANQSDAASMFALGELLYRFAYGCPLHRPVKTPFLPSGIPSLGNFSNWRNAVFAGYPGNRVPSRYAVWRRLAGIGSWGLRSLRTSWRSSEKRPTSDADTRGPARAGLNWMPVTHYQRFWPDMPAFALPSFYDGQIRVNLKGREAQGQVDVGEYTSVLDDISDLLMGCVDPVTGLKAVKSVQRHFQSDPLELADTQADLTVLWQNAPLGLQHPKFGTIGPVPYRRTGGHTGEFGFACFAGHGLERADRGIVSSYDVVPSILDLLGADPRREVSGESLFSRARRNAGATIPEYATRAREMQ